MLRFILFLLLSTLPVYAQGTWPGIEFAEVRAYAWPAKLLETNTVILKGMVLAPGVLNKDGTPLTPEHTKRLLAALNGKHPAHVVARCHVPHNAFVWYDAKKKPVAYLEICFRCFSYRAEPAFPGPIALPATAALFDELKLPLGEDPNLKAFQKRWNDVNGKR